MNTQQSFRKFVAIICFVFLISSINPQSLLAVGSSGFENASYSARSLGQGNAVVARPEEPATTVLNPAGLPELSGIQVSGNLEGLVQNTYFKSARDNGHETNVSQLVLVPTGFVTANLGEQFDNRVGLGVGWTYPFGLSNKYPSTSQMAGYTGYSNRVELSALTIATGVKLTDKINIGGGAVNYRIWEYDQNFNYPNSNIFRNVFPGNSFPDGLVNTYQHGNAWGWILGTLVKPAEHHQVGFFYRSRANVRTHGRAKVNGLVFGSLQGYDTEPYFETGIKSDVQLPSNVTLGYGYIPSQKWSTEVDLSWTGWSVFADQNITFDRNNATTQALGQIPRDFNNTLGLNMGGHYQLNKRWDLLGGLFFYSAASPKDHFDSVIPDSNRYCGNLGFTYKVTENLNFSTTGMLILFEHRSIANPEVTSKMGHSVDGDYTTVMYGFMSGFTYSFGDKWFRKNVEPKIEQKSETPLPVVKHIPGAVK